MEQPLDYLYKLSHDWLLCENSHQLTKLTAQFSLELTGWKTPPKIILAEREPVRFLAGFLAACSTKSEVFLCNPSWGEGEWQQVFELFKPDIIWGDCFPLIQNNSAKVTISTFNLHSSPFIMVPTGGSSGKIKFAIHTWESLTASVEGFTEYFQVNQVNSVCILPLYHVSGLMQFMRSFVTGGKLVILPFKELETSTPLPIRLPTSEEEGNFTYGNFFVSLVPTQLQRLLQNPTATTWLCQFNAVLLGGAPAWDELLVIARQLKIRLAPTYGMTETASQVATIKPDDFLMGKVGCGQVLPHAQIIICDGQGTILEVNKVGNIRIKAKSLALGYYPQIQEKQEYLELDDLGYFDNQGYLYIVGRNSDKIITGGENVYPVEVETAIRDTLLVSDICVIGVPDKHWGQVVTAIYVPQQSSTTGSNIKTALQGKICKFKVPKIWIPVKALPRNIQGKVNRQELQQIAVKFLDNSRQVVQLNSKRSLSLINS